MVSPMDNAYYIDEWAGWATAMAESNIPFRVILDRDLASGGLGNTRLLLMPNTVCLSDADIEAVRRFRANGGRVVATADTALRDEAGAKRPDIARMRFLAEFDLFVPDAIGRAALRGYARKGQPHPVPTDPEAIARIGALIRGFPDALPWRTDAPPGVSVNVLRNGDGSLAIHLLNATGALAKLGNPSRAVPVRPSIPRRPAENITVEIEWPTQLPPQPSIHHFGQAEAVVCPFEWNGATIRLTIPRIGDYAVVAIPNLSTPPE